MSGRACVFFVRWHHRALSRLPCPVFPRRFTGFAALPGNAWGENFACLPSLRASRAGLRENNRMAVAAVVPGQIFFAYGSGSYSLPVRRSTGILRLHAEREHLRRHDGPLSGRSCALCCLQISVAVSVIAECHHFVTRSGYTYCAFIHENWFPGEERGKHFSYHCCLSGHSGHSGSVCGRQQ